MKLRKKKDARNERDVSRRGGNGGGQFRMVNNY
jgi:hypothetical protein